MLGGRHFCMSTTVNNWGFMFSHPFAKGTLVKGLWLFLRSSSSGEQRIALAVARPGIPPSQSAAEFAALTQLIRSMTVQDSIPVFSLGARVATSGDNPGLYIPLNIRFDRSGVLAVGNYSVAGTAVANIAIDADPPLGDLM